MYVMYGYKKYSMTHQQGSHGGLLLTFIHQFGLGDFVYFIIKA